MPVPNSKYQNRLANRRAVRPPCALLDIGQPVGQVGPGRTSRAKIQLTKKSWNRRLHNRAARIEPVATRQHANLAWLDSHRDHGPPRSAAKLVQLLLKLVDMPFPRRHIDGVSLTQQGNPLLQVLDSLPLALAQYIHLRWPRGRQRVRSRREMLCLVNVGKESDHANRSLCVV